MNGLTTCVAVRCDVRFFDEPLYFLANIKEGDTFFEGAWVNEKHHALDLAGIARSMSISIPEEMDFSLEAKAVCFSYNFSKRVASVTALIKSVGRLRIGASFNEGDTWQEAALADIEKLRFSDLPLIGKYLGKDDYFKVNELMFRNGGTSYVFKLDSAVCFAGNNLPLVFELERQKDVKTAAFGNDVAADTPKSKIKWVRIDKKISIVSLNQIGFEFKDGKISLYLDVGLSISIIEFVAYDFCVSMPITFDTKPSFSLGGLGVSVEKGSFSISGGLYKDELDMYTGELSVRFGNFKLVALGSFGYLEDGTVSFFAYLALLARLGGPPVMFITGVAGGFGINRAIKLPQKCEDVKDFPFVSVLKGSSVGRVKKPHEILKDMSGTIVPKKGSYFISAGIRFESFGLIETAALVNIEFGSSFAVSVLGLSSLCVPPKIKENPIAYAELAIKLTFDPQEGCFSLIACLTPESYVFTREAKLTGGFAFCVWYKGDKSGDFVISLGGYHKRFKKPDHYPALDRVRLNWSISKSLSLSGSAYFALTPSAIMAGGSLDLRYQSGALKAWLTAYLDFLIMWKPFFYDISAGICVGVSFTLKILFVKVTIRIELGVSLHVTGPNFGGVATVDFHLFSFDIKFGGGIKKEPQKLNWEQFHETFLDKQSVVSARITDGILSEPPENTNSESKPIKVDPDRFKIEIKSRLPLDSWCFAGEDTASNAVATGIAPMGVENQKSRLVAEAFDLKGKPIKDAKNLFKVTEIKENLPKALWGKPKAPSVSELGEGVVEGVVTGLYIEPADRIPERILPDTGSYDINILLANMPIKRTAYRHADSAIKPISYGGDAVEEIMKTINDSRVAKRRKELFSGLDGLYAPEKTDMAKDLLAMPQLATLAAEVNSDGGDEFKVCKQLAACPWK